MTLYTGLKGQIDKTGTLPTQDEYGEPIYQPYAVHTWADELKSSDGKWRFLKGGSAAGRGVGNVLDSVLADNFTVLSLTCAVKPSYSSTFRKLTVGVDTGFIVQHNPQSNTAGISLRIDNTLSANTSHCATAATKDLAWHWYGFNISGLNVRGYIDSNLLTSTRGAGSLSNSSNVIINSSGTQKLAATLIYSRVLTDTEVQDIMQGKVRPLSVSGCVGYYKFNETHGTAAGVCTDYSGQGNHLTYSGAVWETYAAGGNQNLLTYSQDISNLSGWSAGYFSSVVASDIAAPNGTNTGVTLSHTSGSAWRSNTITGITAGVIYTISIWVKRSATGSADNVRITTNNTVAWNTGVSQRIVLTDSWQRVSVTGVIASSGTSAWVIIGTKGADNSTDATCVGKVDVWGAQLERGSVASTYIPTFATTQVSNVQSGQPYITPIPRTNDWWNRTPVPSSDPERMGSVVASSQITTLQAANSLFALNDDFSFDVLIKNIGNPSSQKTILFGYGTTYIGVSVTLVPASSHLLVRYGNNSTSDTVTFANFPANFLQGNVFRRLTVTRSGNTYTAYINAVPVASVVDTPTVTATCPAGVHYLGAGIQRRSLRLFSRAITAAEVEQLFQTDTITDRTGLVGEWLMNEVHTTAINDTSGNGLNTTTSNLRVIDSPYMPRRKKRRGKQLRLANASASVSNASVRSALVGASVITIAGWVKITKQQFAVSPIFGFLTSASNAGVYLSNTTSGTIGLFARESQVASAVSLYATKKWQEYLGQWVFVSGEVDYANDLGRIYLNGKLIAQNIMAFTAASYSDTGNPTLRVAADTSANNTIDDFRIYTRTLTAQEHMNLFLDQAPRDGLVAEYTFDNDTIPSIVRDSSGNGYDLTPTGVTAANWVMEP